MNEKAAIELKPKVFISYSWSGKEYEDQIELISRRLMSDGIEVIFDKGIIKSSAEKSFSITPSVQGSFSWESDQKFIFTPQDKLRRASSYKVTFNGIILSGRIGL